MRSIMLAAIVLVLQDPLFVDDEWEAWNAFAEGSSVTLEIDPGTGADKITRTVTLKKKAAEAITLGCREGDSDQEDETLEKPKEKPTPPDPSVKCALCGKHVGAETKQSKEKLKIAGKELECTRVEVRTFDCKSAVAFRQVTWYSKSVPGWRAKVETEIVGPKSTVLCVGFSAK